MVMSARVLVCGFDPSELQPPEAVSEGEAEDGIDGELADPEAAGN